MKGRNKKHPLIDNNGHLKTRANLGRVGIQLYKVGNEMKRVLRPVEEVEKTFDSFNNLPVRVEHPDGTKAGDCVEVTYKDGILKGTINLTDADAIGKAISTHKYVSCGYKAQITKESGNWVDQYGVHGHIGMSYEYDYVQRNIVGDHVALVQKPRAGAIASLQLDDINQTITDSFETLFIDGVDEIIEVKHSPESKKSMINFLFGDSVLNIEGDHAEGILKALTTQKEQITNLTDSVTEKQTQIDSLTGQVEASKVTVSNLEDSLKSTKEELASKPVETVSNEEIALRLDAWNEILPHLRKDNADYKPNYSLSVPQIKSLYLEIKAPHLKEKLNDASDAFIDGLWEGLKPAKSEDKEPLNETLDSQEYQITQPIKINRAHPLPGTK